MATSVLNEPQFQNEHAAFDYVEAKLWPNSPVCPRCGEKERVGRLNGKTTRPGLRKCYACRKPFTVRIGSVFEGSHFPLHLWLQAIHLMYASKRGISTRQMQQMFQCSMKTAWHLTRRIRHAMSDDANAPGPPGGADKAAEGGGTCIGALPSRKPAGRENAAPAPGSGHERPEVTPVARRGRVRVVQLENEVEDIPKIVRETSDGKTARTTANAASS